MDRDELKRMWDAAWTEGLWSTAWSKALDGLTPSEAAWKPAKERHSIWQIVNHMLFWREDALNRLAGAGKPSAEHIERMNFPEPTEVSEHQWKALRQRFEQSQQRVSAFLADDSASLDRLRYLLPHDCYHFGQIMYLRALYGKPPLD